MELKSIIINGLFMYFKGEKMNLDKFQLNAIKSKEKSTLVIAPPGSGKTTVILEKVNQLIDKENISHRNILVITFTKAAANNMKDRYKSIYSNDCVPFFGTFHGLFYKILIRIYKNISIINSNVAFFIIKNELEKFSEDVNENKIKEILNLISLKKSNANLDFSNTSEEIFNRCFKVYEDYKNKNNLLDFNDLQNIAYETLIKNKELLNYYRKQFKYILVDEFQDCDETQVNFLKLINTNIFCVGDEDQCIYSFRGSSPSYMVNFTNEFTNGHKVYLKYNYRSAKSIVSLSKNVIRKNIERNNKEVINYKTIIGNTKFFRVDNERAQGIAIAKKIIKNKKNNSSFKDNVILYRTNMESRAILDSFIKFKIPFKVLDSQYNFYDHSICKDLLSYLKLSINMCDKESFFSIANKPFRYISKSNLQYISNSIEETDVFDLLIDNCDIHPFQIKAIEKLRNNIKALNKKTPEKAIISILYDLEYNSYIDTYCEKYKQDRQEIIDIIDEFKEASSEFTGIIEFLNHVDNIEESLKNKILDDEDCVKLSTIHGVKGMEFKNVFIINAVDDYIPHKNSNNLEEERRIFYVAITRAIENLYIYSPRNVSKAYKKITQFMDDLLILKDKNKRLNNSFSLNQKVVSKKYGIGTIEEILENRMKVFFKEDNTLRIFDIDTVVKNNLLQVVK